MFNSKQKIIVLAALILILAFGVFLGTYERSVESATSDQDFKTSEISGSKVITYNGFEGKNALELLQQNNNVRVDKSEFGSFVTEINGIQNSNKEFWMFYVNGNLSPVGADSYDTKNTDVIEWRYEEISN